MKVSKVVEVPGLGSKIRIARKTFQKKSSERIAVAKLAKRAGMTAANWYKIESEDAKALPVETLRKIELVLGVSFGVEL